MATASTTSKPFYIYQLPLEQRRQLCRILDADKRWEELGGDQMGYDLTTITLLGQAILRNQSPTWELLNKWGEKNGTIKSLFIMLAKMDHQRGMSILLPYVDRKYHVLIRNESTLSTAALNFSKNDLPRPSFSQLSFSSAEQSTQLCSHTFQNKDSANIPSQKTKENYSLHSKFKEDRVNLNHSMSSVSLQSKMNNLSNHTSKNPDINSLYLKSKKRSNKDESNIDNCASEKIKNIGKTSTANENILKMKEMKMPLQNNCATNFDTLEITLSNIMKISYLDIQRSTNNFDKSRILGKGGFGTVYRGEWKGTSVAIKRLMPREGNPSNSQHLVSLKQSLNELNILQCCRFDHILPLYGVSLDGEDPCLVYQLMVNGSLEDRLLCKNNTTPLTWSQRSHIAECTAKGLYYLHTKPGKPLVHGDIKSANILLDANMDAKIGDFGLSREGPGGNATHVQVSRLHGTECYLPHEYLRNRHLSPSVDVYSYGIVLLEMATGLRPLDAKRQGKSKTLVEYVNECNKSGRLDPLRDTKAGEENMIWFRELLKIGQKCSSEEKKNRPPMKEVLEYFEKIKDEMSMVDKLRRLSNDKGNSIKTGKLSLDPEALKKLDPELLKKLNPYLLQYLYDSYKEEQCCNNNNEETSKPGPGDKVLAMPLQNIALPSQSANQKDIELKSNAAKTEASSKMPKTIQIHDSQECSDSSSYIDSSSENTISIVHSKSNLLENECPSSPNTDNVPLCSLLKMPVPQFIGDVDENNDSHVENVLPLVNAEGAMVSN